MYCTKTPGQAFDLAVMTPNLKGWIGSVSLNSTSFQYRLSEVSDSEFKYLIQYLFLCHCHMRTGMSYPFLPSTHSICISCCGHLGWTNKWEIPLYHLYSVSTPTSVFSLHHSLSPFSVILELSTSLFLKAETQTVYLTKSVTMNTGNAQIKIFFKLLSLETRALA